MLTEHSNFGMINAAYNSSGVLDGATHILHSGANTREQLKTSQVLIGPIDFQNN